MYKKCWACSFVSTKSDHVSNITRTTAGSLILKWPYLKHKTQLNFAAVSNEIVTIKLIGARGTFLEVDNSGYIKTKTPRRVK